MKITTTVTFTATITALKRVDSRTPTIKRAVSPATAKNAGRLNHALTCVPSASATSVPGAAVSWAGMGKPRSRSRLAA